MATATLLDPQISMRDLLEKQPGAQRALFKKYHIGGCASCGFRPDETLAQVCERNGNLPMDEVIAHLQQSQEEEDRMQISPAELAEKMRDDAGVKMIDVRTREEFEAARLEGATLFSQELLQEALMKWDRNAPVVFICHHGVRSLDAAAYFAGHGFTNVRSLTGGVDAWSTEIDPTVPRYHLE